MFDDGQCVLSPSHPAVENALTFTVKTIEIAGRWNSSVKKTKEIAFIKSGENLITFQGFRFLIADILNRHNCHINIIDNRRAFPKPNLKKIRGCRFSQESIVKQIVQAEKSGLVSVVTRYGKTRIMANVLACYPDIPAIVAAPGSDLVRQLHEDFTAFFGEYRNVVKIGGGRGSKSQQGPDITICSADSLHLCDTNTRLILCDEAHAFASDTRSSALAKFNAARKIGFGASLNHRFDNRDYMLTGLFGPVIAAKTYKEAVAEKAICPINVFMLRVQYRRGERVTSNRNLDYRNLLFRHEGFLTGVSKICELLPQDWQIIIFIAVEEQADRLLNIMSRSRPDSVVAMAKKLTAQERDKLAGLMRNGQVTRCIASNIYAQGITFHNVRAIINASGGGGNISSIQKPGRLAELRPEINKKSGIVIDFMFENCGALTNESYARLKSYQETGYNVTICDSLNEMIEKIKTAA